MSANHREHPVFDPEAAFWRQIEEHRGDPLPHLIDADWRDENDHADRAEYLRLVVVIAERTAAREEVDSPVGRLCLIARSSERDWRSHVSRAHRVFLDDYDLTGLISLVRLIRYRFGFNLAEAQSITRQLPSPMATTMTRE